MGGLHPDNGGAAASDPDSPYWTAEALRESLRPLAGSGSRGRPRSPVLFLTPSDESAGGGVGEPRWELVLVLDDNPSLWIWADAVAEFCEALGASGVFRDVQVRRLGADDSGRPVLRGSADSCAPLEWDEFLDAARRRLVLVVTDVAHPMWRSGEVWAPLRRWGAVHPVTVASPLPWQAHQRVGVELHRLRVRSVEPGAPNSRQEWRPQVDVPGVFDTLRGSTPFCFVEFTLPGMGQWSRLAVGTGWTDAAAALWPPASARADTPTGSDPVRLSPAQLVAAYRVAASKAVFDLAVRAAAAPLEIGLLVRISERTHPRAGRLALSEFLAGPLVRPPTGSGHPEKNRAVFRFVADGVRAELLAYGRRSETERVRHLVWDYLVEHGVDPAAYDSALDEEQIHRQKSVVAAPPHVVEADIAVHQALSGLHLAYSKRPGDPNFPLPSGTVESADIGVSQSDERGRTRVRTEAEGAERNAGGVEVTSTVDREKERRKTLVSPVFGGVPPRNPNFTGRVDLLQELERRLVRGATAALLPEALHGMGGVGKSQLAIEYAYRNRAKFDVIWWIPAERSLKIVNSLVELGERLDLNVGTEANVAVQQVLDALKSGNHHKVPSNWLLIFDNADSPAAVRQYLPTGGTGRILVTSRNSQWLSVARPLEITVFRRAESVQLLRRRDADLTEEDADLLADALGDLPLAVAQAAAWRVETGMPASEYLELLAEKQLELLDVTTTLDYPESVAAMWNLSLNELKRKNVSALRLLQTCAFLAPEPIRRTMFTASRNIDAPPELSRVLRDRLKLNEAIRDINRFALVRIDHRTNSIELHRLVQAVLVSQMTDEERAQMRHAAHQMLGANDPEAPDESEHWATYADLSAHLAASDAYESDDESVRTLLANQVQFLYRWGEHEQSAELSERVYHIWRARLGEEHPETLRMGRWYGAMLWAVGRYDEAAALNLELLDLHRATFGDEHEDTIDALGSVAADKRAKGDFDLALELSRRNYDTCVRYLGDDDPVTMNAAHNLGVSLRLVGDFRAALELDTTTLDQKYQIYGEGHDLTLITQVSLTIDLRETGDYQEARAQQEEIVRAYERQRRPLNPSLLRAVRQLAVMRRKAGDHEGALEAADRAYNGLMTRYGPDHAETLAAALCRSVELRHHGRSGAAMQLAHDTLMRYERTLGSDHPHTLAAAVNVALLRRLMGEHQSARDLDEVTFASFRDRLGDDHPSTVVTAINLASDRYAVGDLAAAVELDEKMFERAVTVFGEDHPTTLACQVNLAQDRDALGQRDEADRLRRTALEALAMRLGPNHPAVAQLGDVAQRANCDIDPLPL